MRPHHHLLFCLSLAACDAPSLLAAPAAAQPALPAPPSVTPSAAPGAFVWALIPNDAAATRFAVRRAAVQTVTGDQVRLRMAPADTPGAFVWTAPAATLRPGAPVLASPGAAAMYGRVRAVGPTGAEVQLSTGGAPSVRTFPPDELLALGDAWSPGQPLLIDAAGARRFGVLLHATADRVFYAHGPTYDAAPRASARLVSLAPLRVGARVLAMPPSGATRAPVEGAVAEVVDAGFEYQIRADDGRLFRASFAHVSAL